MASTWYLERQLDDGRKILRSRLSPLPFRVGRRYSCDLVIDSRHASNDHAELYQAGEGLWIRDLGSTNGTYVNGERLTSVQPVFDQDLIHFGDHGFRLCLVCDGQNGGPMTTECLDMTALPLVMAENLRALIDRQALQVVYQPVVRLREGERGGVMGFEALGRAEVQGAEILPTQLFLAAATIGLEAALSCAFRLQALAEADQLPGGVLFVNTHPRELADDHSLLESLVRLREAFPDPHVVLEIHESAVPRPESLKGLVRELGRLGIGLAFDDFGTGQARLMELSEVAPNYLKFDGAWIRKIHLASRRKREVVRALVALSRDLGVLAVAEGVESGEEGLVCSDLGFELAQGYHFGRPARAATFARKS